MDLHPPPILKFISTMVSRYKEDQVREFVIEYYINDLSISIYERTIPNNGFHGGRFLQKTIINNPKTGKPYQPTDIYIGNTLYINNYEFILQEAFEETLRIMESNPDMFVMCDLNKILMKIRQSSKNKIPQILTAFQSYDRNKRLHISLPDTKAVFQKFGIELQDQEFLTILRRFQYSDFARFQYDDFIKSIA